MTDQPTVAPARKSSGSDHRFIPCIVIALIAALLFIGGTAAGLYAMFSQVSGVQNVWLLVCGAPAGLVLLGGITAFSMYTRYGQPLRDIFRAIDSVADGDLSVRVPKDDSPQFGELIKRFNKMVAELARADQQRRNLTADIAHELRTPLHIIQGNLEGILDGVYQPTPEHINDTLEETRLLARLVNDLQTLSLAESGQLPLHPTHFRLADLLEDVRASFAAQAAAGGIALETTTADPDQTLTADYLRLNQVLANLVSNALRHTPPDGSVTLATLAAESGMARLHVRDTGVGIAAEDLPFIFDRFWRGEKARTREGHSSSGLGLAIARQLIQAHGGTIEAMSEAGKGTTFVIDLPEELPQSEPN